jgi:hypothetical protein
MPDPDQAALFTEEDLAPPRRPDTDGPCLFSSPARGIIARGEEAAAWQAEHGIAKSPTRSHAWQYGPWMPDPTEEHGASVLSAHVDPSPVCPGHHATVSWYAPGHHLIYRGCCTGCDWEAGQTADCENGAAEDALDHAWPGWRDLPVVKQLGYEPTKAQLARWVEQVSKACPPGWLQAGGPIRTMRDGVGYRSVPKATPFGGYDAAANWRDLINIGRAQPVKL